MIEAIVYGVIAAAIYAVLRFTLVEHVAPRFRGWRRSVPNLNGTKWLGFSPESIQPDEPNSRLILEQVGDRVKASVERDVLTGKRNFRYAGAIASGQIVLSWEEPEGAGYIVGAMVLKLSGNLRELRGRTTFYHHDKGKVISEEKLYRRDDTQPNSTDVAAQTEPRKTSPEPLHRKM